MEEIENKLEQSPIQDDKTNLIDVLKTYPDKIAEHQIAMMDRTLETAELDLRRKEILVSVESDVRRESKLDENKESVKAIGIENWRDQEIKKRLKDNQEYIQAQTMIDLNDRTQKFAEIQLEKMRRVFNAALVLMGGRYGNL